MLSAPFFFNDTATTEIYTLSLHDALPTSRPLCQKICYSDCTKNCPLCPLRAPRRFRNPKICQQLGAQATARFREMIEIMTEAMIDVEIDALIDPLPPFTFCRPFSFDSKLIW